MVINEIMFNPCEDQGSDDNYEYFEIVNPTEGCFDLTGVSITEGVEFTFPSGAQLGPGEYALLAKDAATISALDTVPDGTQVWQWDSGGINNGGEDIQIVLNDEVLDVVDYDDNSAWDVHGNLYDGDCYSLELDDPSSDNGDSDNAGDHWGQSCTLYGTPGAPNDVSCWYDSEPEPEPEIQVLSLYEINTNLQNEGECHASVYEHQLVQVTAYVSAVDSNGFYVQDSPSAGLNQGIFVYTGYGGYGLDAREVGEQVQITSLVYEYYGMTELDMDGTDGADADVTSLSTGATMVPYETTTGAIGEECEAGGEEYEGLLVKLTNVEIIGEPNNYGEVSIDDGSGVTQLEDGLLDTDSHLADLLGTDTLTGQVLESITGVVHYAYSSYEVHPRTTDDIVVSGLSFLPSKFFVYIHSLKLNTKLVS